MLPKRAVILHAENARCSCTRNRFVVHHFILKPQIRNLQPNHVVHNLRHKLRGAKHIHQIDARAGLLARCFLR